MNQGRMGVDPSLAVVSARRTLRRLELEAYASVMSAFRAQGPLTGDKKSSLDQLGKLLGISSERHRAEVRRAVNDELLSAVAGCVCSADSEILWQKEGQKLASTNPRFVARQLPHLPQLLTSAAVSSALGLQNTKSDPNLRKNTSAQVQNVLKFIISQNPLNAASATKQQLNKLSLPAAGNTAKSPSKPTVTSTPATPSTSQQVSGSPVPPTTSPSPQLTASPIKTAVKGETTTTAIKDSSTLTPSPGKTVSAPVVRPESTKPGTGGAKSSMLVDLLEAGVTPRGGEAQPTAAGGTDTSTELSTDERATDPLKPSQEKVSEVEEGEKISTPITEVVQKDVDQQMKEEQQDGGETEKEGSGVGSGLSEAVESETEGKTERVSRELECEEMMPELAVVRGRVTAASSVSEPLQREAEKEAEAQSPVKNESLVAVYTGESGAVDHVKESESVVKTIDTNESALVEGTRKRPCPTDLPLPPSKTARLTPPHSPPPPPSPIPPPSSPLTVPSLTPVSTTIPPSAPAVQNVPTAVTTTVQSVTTAVTTAVENVTTAPPQSPAHLPSPPPLLLIPPSSEPEPSFHTPSTAIDKESSVPNSIESTCTSPNLSDATPLEAQTPPSATSPTVVPTQLDIRSEGQLPVAPPTPDTGVASSSAVVDIPSPSERPPPTSFAGPSLVIQPSSADSHVTPTTTTTAPITHLQVGTINSPLELLPLLNPETAPQQAPPTAPSTALQFSTSETSTTDEALIRELCSEATEETTAAALASQLGLEFLEQSFLGGMDLIQLVQSPFDSHPPSLSDGELSSSEPPVVGSGLPPLLPVDPGIGDKGEGGTPVLPDTTQLLSEALTSLSTPSTPILPPSSLPPLPPALFPGSPSLLPTESPVQPTPTLTSSILTPHSSPFTPHTPSILTPHAPSISSPLTPEILPDLDSLSSVNEADLLEGIPPEIAETIQALAQFDQQNYHSPLQ